jgi:hypothetical protein
MGPIGCLETSVISSHSTLRKIAKERRSHWHRDGSLKSSRWCLFSKWKLHTHAQSLISPGSGTELGTFDMYKRCQWSSRNPQLRSAGNQVKSLWQWQGKHNSCPVYFRVVILLSIVSVSLVPGFHDCCIISSHLSISNFTFEEVLKIN